MSDPQANIKLFSMIAAFGLVAALWLAGLTIWYVRRARRKNVLHQRLGLATGPQQEERVLRLWKDGEVVETSVNAEPKISFSERLDQLREDAGWSIPMAPLLLGYSVAVLVFCAVLFVVTGNILLPAVALPLAVLAFRAVLQFRINKRRELFERQLVEALDLGSRSLRAGHPLSGAFHLIADELQPPVGLVFAGICEQEALGVGVPSALGRAAKQSRSPDMKIFAASVVIQLRSGGNLADMMERVAWVLRERMRLSRRARVLSAEAQLSKWVLMALPLGLFLGLNVMNPAYMTVMYNTTIGNALLAGCALSLMIGSWIMSKMATIKY